MNTIDEFSECCLKLWEEGTLTPKLEAYDDGYGNPTISIGCTEGVYFGMKITAEQAEQMYKRELAKHVAIVNRRVKRDLTPWQTGACVSFQYNEGERSSFYAAVNSKDYLAAVPALMMKFVYAKNQRTGRMERSEGLVHRRTHEIALWNGAYHDARIPVPEPYPSGITDGRYAADVRRNPSRKAIAAVASAAGVSAPTAVNKLPAVPESFMSNLDNAEQWQSTWGRLWELKMSLAPQPLILAAFAAVGLVLFLRSRNA